MKRITSILLVLVMVLSSAAIVGCDLSTLIGGEGTTATTTTTTTTTTTENTSPENPPEELVIKHGDNFTEEDIEFVRNLQGEYNGPSRDHTLYSFEKMISAVSSGAPIYRITVDVDNPYYICAYADIEDLDTSELIILNVSAFSWYKFYDAVDIPTSDEGETIELIYAVFDCTIEEDIVSRIEYNYMCKYYVKCHSSSLSLDEPLDEWNRNMLIQDYNVFSGEKQNVFLLHKDNPYYIFPVYEDENGYNYLYFTYVYKAYVDGEKQPVYYSNAKEMLGDYYDALSPYFEILPVAGEKGISLNVLVDCFVKE